MSVKGKVKRANKRIEELEYLLKYKEQTERNFKRLSEDYQKLEEQVKVKDNILKQLVIRECGGLRGGINLMVDSCVDDIDFKIDEVEMFNVEVFARNQKCYRIRIYPKWR